MFSKNILLVGGCGFIGHNLAIHLKKLGHRPVIVDSLSVNNILSFADKEVKNKKLYSAILQNRIDILNEEAIQLIIQDARDYHAVSKIYNDISPDIIIHLAGEPISKKRWTKKQKSIIKKSRTLSTSLLYLSLIHI